MFLLDTNALSEPLKRRPSEAFMSRLEASRRDRRCTSVICAMEMRYGCARRPDGEALWSRIRRELLGRVEILPVDEAVAERAGDLMAAVRRKGRLRSTEDLLIAATGLVHGLTLVTHNIQDFVDLQGLRIEDWMRAD